MAFPDFPAALSRALTPLALVGLLFGTAPASAVTFGGLNVTPRGGQNLNLETGATDMPAGGTVTDKKGSLTMTAQKIQLQPGEVLTAQGATIKTKYGGTLTASQVTYNLKKGTVNASGQVSYSDARFKNLVAQNVFLEVASGFVVASGGIKAASPALTGARLAFDPNTMQAVATGPYSLSTRLGRMTASTGQVLMTFAGNLMTSATAKASADDLARFLPYLK